MSDGKSIWIDNAVGGKITEERPTARLRWKAGVLQQAWTRQIMGEPATVEWRDIPTEEPA